MIKPPRSLDALSWAIFLACSWTWCIGMFLPVLLVRDYGVGGWMVFAVPNVIGAAAMGWVIRSPAHSQSIVEQHRAACIAFSLVTIAFQIFFAGWLLGMTSLVLIVPLVVVQIMLDMDRFAAAGVWIASAVAFGVLFYAGGAFVEPALPPEFVAQPKSHLFYLAPVCAFGFLLCPYLDLTFHHAHRSSPNARLAFGLGFGVFFLVMILFTLAYAGLLAGAASGIGVTGATTAHEAIGVHMAIQLIFTVAVHGRAVRASVTKPQAAWALLVGAVVIGALLALARSQTFTLRPPSLPEIVYRAFMGFYGLVFPAYVWLCMIPSTISRRRATATLVIAVALATPMFWLGFIEQRMHWLVPGLLVVMFSRLLAGRRRVANV